jgi:hypothetical protein
MTPQQLGAQLQHLPSGSEDRHDAALRQMARLRGEGRLAEPEPAPLPDLPADLADLVPEPGTWIRERHRYQPMRRGGSLRDEVSQRVAWHVLAEATLNDRTPPRGPSWQLQILCGSAILSVYRHPYIEHLTYVESSTVVPEGACQRCLRGKKRRAREVAALRGLFNG